MDKTPKYIKMCEEAPKELWDKVEHCGSFIAWRSFIGMIMPNPDRKRLEGLASVIPETLVLRTWLKERMEKIIVLETDVDYGGSDGDKGTPLYRQDQLQKMLAVRGFSWLLITFFQFCRQQLKKHSWLTGQVDSPLDSLEKLWLAFVMNEKYGKIWNDKKEIWE